MFHRLAVRSKGIDVASAKWELIPRGRHAILSVLWQGQAGLSRRWIRGSSGDERNRPQAR